MRISATGAIFSGLLLATPAFAQSSAMKAAIGDKWECIAVNSVENHPGRARFAGRKGCASEFHEACEDADGAPLIACLKRETAIWDGIIDGKLVAGARENEASARGATASMIEAARAMRASRAKTCGFVRKFGVNVTPTAVAHCELEATAKFAMTIYSWLYTP